jgi:hypothetical protein
MAQPATMLFVDGVPIGRVFSLQTSGHSFTVETRLLDSVLPAHSDRLEDLHGRCARRDYVTAQVVNKRRHIVGRTKIESVASSRTRRQRLTRVLITFCGDVRSERAA